MMTLPCAISCFKPVWLLTSVVQGRRLYSLHTTPSCIGSSASQFNRQLVYPVPGYGFRQSPIAPFGQLQSRRLYAGIVSCGCAFSRCTDTGTEVPCHACGVRVPAVEAVPLLSLSVPGVMWKCRISLQNLV